MIVRNTLIYKLIIFIILSAYNICFAQNIEQPVYNYELNLTDNENYDSFSFLDSITNKYKMYVFGESHTLQGNDEFINKLFKYLYYKADVRVFIDEMNSDIAYLISRYIVTNDQFYVKKVKDFFPEFNCLGKIEYLFRFYTELPEDEKFTYYGVDYSSNIKSFGFVIEDIISRYKSELDENTLNLWSKCKQAIDICPYSYYATIPKETTKFIKHYNANTKTINSALGNDSVYFHLVIKGLEFKHPFYDYNKFKTITINAYRDDYLYRNYIYVMSLHEKEKFLCNHGSAHIYPFNYKKKLVCDYNPVIPLLNDSSIVSDSICTFYGIYFKNYLRKLKYGKTNNHLIWSESQKKKITIHNNNNREKFVPVNFLVVNRIFQPEVEEEAISFIELYNRLIESSTDSFVLAKFYSERAVSYLDLYNETNAYSWPKRTAILLKADTDS